MPQLSGCKPPLQILYAATKIKGPPLDSRTRDLGCGQIHKQNTLKGSERMLWGAIVQRVRGSDGRPSSSKVKKGFGLGPVSESRAADH